MHEKSEPQELGGATLNVCRAALARGPLVRDGTQWRCYGRRRFSNTTVKQLIEAGVAVRDGRTVRLAPVADY